MSRDDGFTLIELLITVAILLILAVIAIPNYRGHVLRSNRADGMATLMRISAAQEKFYLQNNTYTTDLGPDGLNIDNATRFYSYTVTSDDLTANFVATAKPVDGQLADKKCTTLTVDNVGTRSATDSANADSTSVCWR